MLDALYELDKHYKDQVDDPHRVNITWLAIFAPCKDYMVKDAITTIIEDGLCNYNKKLETNLLLKQ